MSEKLNLDKHLIKYKGLCDFDGLYNLIVQWLKARGYHVQETKYKHKVPSPLGAEQEITFKGEREVTDFYTYHIVVDFFIRDMTEVEVEIRGEKKQLTDLRMEITLTGTLELDPEGRYEKNMFLKKLRHFYIWYIIKADLFEWYDELRYRIYKLHGVIKDYLDMQAKGNEYIGYLGDTK